MLAKHTLIHFVGFGLTGIIGIVSLALYTRLLGPAAYGHYAVVMVFAFTIVPIFFDWIRVSFVRFRSEKIRINPAHLNSSVLALYGIGAAGAVTLATSLNFINLTPQFNSIWLLGLALASSQALFDLQQSVFRSDLRSIWFSFFQVMRAAFALVLGVILVAWGMGYEGLAFGIILSYFFAGLVAAYLIKSEWRLIKLKSIRRSSILLILKFGLPVGAVALSNTALAYFDRVLLAYFTDPTTVGRYAAIADIVQKSIVFTMAVVHVAAYPLAIKQFELEGVAGAKRQVSENITLWAALLGPCVIYLVLDAQALVRFTIGDQYVNDAAWMLPLLVLSQLLMGLRVYVFEPILHLANKTYILLWPVAGGAVISVSAGVLMIPFFASAGAILAGIAGQAFSLLIVIVQAKRTSMVAIPKKDLIKIFIALLAMSITLRAAETNNWRQFLLTGIVSFFVYVFLLFVVDLKGIRRMALEFVRMQLRYRKKS